jgi:hypothetical protein
MHGEILNTPFRRIKIIFYGFKHLQNLLRFYTAVKKRKRLKIKDTVYNCRSYLGMNITKHVQDLILLLSN